MQTNELNQHSSIQNTNSHFQLIRSHVVFSTSLFSFLPLHMLRGHFDDLCHRHEVGQINHHNFFPDWQHHGCYLLVHLSV